MPALAGLIGGSVGLCVQLYSNGVRRLPLMRHPWEHLVAIGLGSAFGNGLVKWEEQVRVDLDKSIESARTANRRRFAGVENSWVLLTFVNFACTSVMLFFGRLLGFTYVLRDIQ